MIPLETTPEECTTCRRCPACKNGVHSACYPVPCEHGGRRHACNCKDRYHQVHTDFTRPGWTDPRTTEGETAR